DFVVLDFIVDPRVPLILRRPFLSIAHAIINVHEREIILGQDKQSLTLQCGDTPFIKKYKFKSLNKIDFIDAGESDFYSKEIENFLNDNSIPIGVENSVFNMEEDILYLESLLSEEPYPSPPINPNQTKSPIKEHKHSFSMGYEHFSTTLITELDEVAESSTKNLVPIPQIDIITNTDDVLPPGVKNDDDSEGEVNDVEELRVDNFDDEASDFDNPSVPLPPPEPPDAEYDFELDAGDEILVVMNVFFE
nr:hypothetical protein [Tanacetum cinerariifolium]